MNHKRKRPKQSRAGCLMCKPHKANLRGDEDLTATNRRKKQSDEEQIKDMLQQLARSIRT